MIICPYFAALVSMPVSERRATVFTCLNWPLGKATVYERAWSWPVLCRSDGMMGRQQGVILIMFTLCCMLSLIMDGMDGGCVEADRTGERGG